MLLFTASNGQSPRKVMLIENVKCLIHAVEGTSPVRDGSVAASQLTHSPNSDPFLFFFRNRFPRTSSLALSLLLSSDLQMDANFCVSLTTVSKLSSTIYKRGEHWPRPQTFANSAYTEVCHASFYYKLFSFSFFF